MINFLIKHKVKIFLITIIGFFAGTFVGFGSYLFSDRSSIDTVAVVNGTEIPYRVYYSLYNNAINMHRQSGNEINEAAAKTIQANILQSLVKDELVCQQAKNYGVFVSDEELAMDIQHFPYFVNDKGFFDSRIYFAFLNNIRLAPKDFEEYRRKQLISRKVQILIASAISNVSEAEINYAKDVYKTDDKNSILQQKNNEILNDWFNKVLQKSKIKFTMLKEN